MSRAGEVGEFAVGPIAQFAYSPVFVLNENTRAGKISLLFQGAPTVHPSLAYITEFASAPTPMGYF